MNSFWNRATIIETERKNFDSSMRLIDAVVSRINAMNIASEDKEKVFKKLTEDLSGNGVRSLTTSAGRGDNGIPYKQVTTRVLPEFLTVAKMSLQDFWEVCFPEYKLIELMPEDADPNDPKYQNVDRYLSKELSDLYRTLDRMDKETRREVGKIAMMLTPTFWHSDLDELMTMRRHLGGDRAAVGAEKNPYLAMGPVGKMWALIQRKFLDDEALPKREKKAPAGSQAKAVLHKMRIRRRQGFRVTALPVVCNIFGVSLHHILNMPDEVKLYAKEDGTEQIVTAYTFMSETNKQIFRDMLTKGGFAK